MPRKQGGMRGGGDGKSGIINAPNHRAGGREGGPGVGGPFLPGFAGQFRNFGFGREFPASDPVHNQQQHILWFGLWLRRVFG